MTEERRTTDREIKHLMEDHFLADDIRFKNMEDTQKRILEILEPMAEIFNGVSFSGKLIANIMKLMALTATAVAAYIYFTKLK